MSAAAMKILQQHETEMGENVRQQLTARGIQCESVGNSFEITPPDLITSVFGQLFTYCRKSDGVRLWLLEIESYTPPDIQWWRSWVTDAPPTPKQIKTILLTNPQTGQEIYGTTVQA